MPKTVDIQKLYNKLVAIHGDWSENSNSVDKIEINHVKSCSLLHQIFLRRIGGALENHEASLTIVTIENLSERDANSLREVITFIENNEVSEIQTTNNAVNILDSQYNAEVVVSESGGSVLSILSYIFCCVCLYGAQQGAMNSAVSKYNFGGVNGHDDDFTGY